MEPMIFSYICSMVLSTLNESIARFGVRDPMVLSVVSDSIIASVIIPSPPVIRLIALVRVAASIVACISLSTARTAALVSVPALI